MFTQNQPMVSRQSVQFCNSNRGDPGQALELTPPRGPNFRPETSGLMVIALTTKHLSTGVHLAAAWCTVCLQACSKQQCAHLIQKTCRIGIVGGGEVMQYYSSPRWAQYASPHLQIPFYGQRTNIIHTCINMEWVIVRVLGSHKLYWQLLIEINITILI